VQLIFGPDGGDSRTLGETDLVELYRYPAPEGRGWVRSNFVMSLDGSVQGPDGRSGSINTESDHRIFALQRALADAVLVGANTVRLEGYRAIDLEPWQLRIREQEGLAPYPALVIISASADLDPVIATPAEGDGGAVTIITTAGKSPDDLAPLRAAGITVLQTDGRRVTHASSCCRGRPGLAIDQRRRPSRAELIPAASRPVRRRRGAVRQLSNCQRSLKSAR
jgi:hypothetical protein